jgi:hypothetical protein
VIFITDSSLAVILTQPPVEIRYFHWRFCYTNRQWKLYFHWRLPVEISFFPLAVVLRELPVEIGFHWRFPSRAHLVFFTGAR